MLCNKYTHGSNLIRSAIPYTDRRSKKTMGLILSFMDLLNSFHGYSNEDDLKACDLDQEETDINALLNGIRPSCSDNEAAMVDQILGFLNVFKIMDVFNSFSSMASQNKDSYGDNQGFDTMDLLKNFLPEDQIETFENLSMILTAMSYDDNNTYDVGSEEDE